MKPILDRRRQSLTSSFSDSKIDSLVITSPVNWFYLTGFTGESGALIVSRKGSALITDGRFMVQGRRETSGIRLIQQKGSLVESVSEFLKDSRSQRVGFDAAQVAVGQMQTLRRATGARAPSVC